MSTGEPQSEQPTQPHNASELPDPHAAPTVETTVGHKSRSAIDQDTPRVLTPELVLPPQTFLVIDDNITNREMAKEAARLAQHESIGYGQNVSSDKLVKTIQSLGNGFGGMIFVVSDSEVRNFLAKGQGPTKEDQNIASIESGLRTLAETLSDQRITHLIDNQPIRIASSNEPETKNLWPKIRDKVFKEKGVNPQTPAMVEIVGRDFDVDKLVDDLITTRQHTAKIDVNE